MSREQPWWEKRREEQRKYAADVSYGAWRAGVGADQNADYVAHAFDSGVTADEYVRCLRRKADIEAAAKREQQEKQQYLESTCMHEDVGGPCWGHVEGRGYDGSGTYATFIYACEGHTDVTSRGVYCHEDGAETEVVPK